MKIEREFGMVILLVVVFAASAALAEKPWASAPVKGQGKVVLRLGTATGEDPTEAGKSAAEALKRAMGDVAPKIVILSECFEDKPNKEKVLAGVTSVLPKDIVVGAATYGSFTQAGCTDADSVCLAGIGGEGISVAAALATNMGAAHLTYDGTKEIVHGRRKAAGAKLAQSLRRTPQDRLLVLLADAHAPKNQALMEGVQKVVGAGFPITGGCANKNAGQTFVYYGGRMHEDAAVAVMLSGDFQVGLSGRQAKDNEAVIRTAGQGAQEAIGRNKGRPVAALAFNCAGRRSKLKNIAEELVAIRKAIGAELPLFGCYCAGEMGPVDQADKPAGALCGGSGWHIMFTVLSTDH